MDIIGLIKYFFPNFKILENVDIILLILVFLTWLIHFIIFIIPFKKGGFKTKIITGLLFSLYFYQFTENLGPVEVVDIQKMVQNNQKPGVLHLMSFNLRDSRIDQSRNQWENRFELVVDTIQTTLPDVVGMQEGEVIQLEQLYEKSNLKQIGYKQFGEATVNTTHDSAIGYNSKSVENLENGTFWLSETPQEQQSKLPESALTRSCSWGKFRFLENGREFYVFNLHLDHISELARQKQAQVVIDQAQKITQGFDGPIFVMGDFNSFPHTASPTKFEQNGFQEIRTIDVSKNHSPGQVFSFHAFLGMQVEQWYIKLPIKIVGTLLSSLPGIKEKIPCNPFAETYLMDFIFQGGNVSGINMRGNYILNNEQNGQYQSDHYPHNVYYDFI